MRMIGSDAKVVDVREFFILIIFSFVGPNESNFANDCRSRLAAKSPSSERSTAVFSTSILAIMELKLTSYLGARFPL